MHCVELSGGIVGIKDWEFGLLKEFTFGITVFNESAMIIEMIVSEIRKDGNFNRDAESAVLGESMGSDFENEVFGTLLLDLRNALVQGKGINCSHMA